MNTELHNRVFLGCRNFSCAVCRSIAHSTIIMPFHQPVHSPLPRTISAQIHQLRPTLPKHLNQPFTPHFHLPPLLISQVCASFNTGRCSRQRCWFMHVCNFCGGAHARLICPVQKAANKNAKQYLSTPVNVSRLSSELFHHPDSHFTDYVFSGLSHGFHPGVGNLPSQSLICPNLQSALAELETVDLLIKKETDANFMIGPSKNFLSTTMTLTKPLP